MKLGPVSYKDCAKETCQLPPSAGLSTPDMMFTPLVDLSQVPAVNKEIYKERERNTVGEQEMEAYLEI